MPENIFKNDHNAWKEEKKKAKAKNGNADVKLPQKNLGGSLDEFSKTYDQFAMLMTAGATAKVPDLLKKFITIGAKILTTIDTYKSALTKDTAHKLGKDEAKKILIAALGKMRTKYDENLDNMKKQFSAPPPPKPQPQTASSGQKPMLQKLKEEVAKNKK